MLYIKENIPSGSLTEIKLGNNIQNIFIKINLRAKKWLILGFYNPKLKHLKPFTKNWHGDIILLFKMWKFYSTG